MSEGILPVEAKFQRKYQVTHVTLVEGELDPTYFGHREGDSLPDTIGCEGNFDEISIDVVQL
jgi:hypothetical protein